MAVALILLRWRHDEPYVSSWAWLMLPLVGVILDSYWVHQRKLELIRRGIDVDAKDKPS